VGVQGVAMAERATQAALAYAGERKQGRAPGQTEGSSPIIAHPDVKRMLLEMRAKTLAARMLCMATAAALDASTRAGTEEARRQAHARASLLTPLAKAYATDIAVEVSSAAVQVHGGMGYMEQTGVAQFYRDARILPIYEGTNGIQAIDLVTRKLLLENGATLAETLKRSCSSLAGLTGEAAAGHMLSVQQAMAGTLAALPSSDTSLAVATPFLRALAAFIAAGLMADAATCAKGGPLHDEAEANARYYAAVELPSAMAAAQGALAVAATIAGATF
jgi:hypothetical protein